MMRFLKEEAQIISNSYKHGYDLIAELKENNVEVIPEGMLMVSKIGFGRLYGFEVGKNFPVASLRDTQLMYPIPGSCCIFGGDFLDERKRAERKTCILRYCRLPTEEEFDRYKRCVTV